MTRRRAARPLPIQLLVIASLSVLHLTLHAQSARLLDDTEEPALRVFLAEQRDPLGRRCALRSLASSGALRFAACGAAGLWVLRASAGAAPQLVRQQLFEGAVSGLFLRDGELWIELSSVRALPLAGGSELEAGAAPLSPPPPAAGPLERDLPPSAAGSPPAPPTPAAPLAAREVRLDGRVVAVEPGYAVIDLGALEVSDGDRIAFHEIVHEAIDGSPSSMRRELLAVGRVVNVAENRARVELGPNESVAVGSAAERTHLALSAASFAPPRAAAVWDVAFLLRGFLVLENLGLGAFLDARVGYHMRAPVHIEALLSPFAVASARDGATVPAAGLLSASFDSRLFEIGLGVGGQTVNHPDISLNPGSGTTLGQRLRLGARDGAHIEAFSYVVLFHSEFRFSFLRVQAQVPLGQRAWLFAAGGGGTLGLGFGEIGLRLLTSGNGGPGSFFLSTVIGAVHVFRGCEVVNDTCLGLDYAGPMLGMGGEWRL
jgi:hypothetical protein